MISYKTLANAFENLLNENTSSEISFTIATETGEFIHSVRNRNDITTVINGIFANISSDVSNTNNGLSVVTMTNKFDFVVACKDNEEDIYENRVNAAGNIEKTLITHGNAWFLSNIRDILNNVCEKNIFTELKDENGIDYDVSATYTLDVTGERVQLPELGDCFSFSVYGYYNLIAGGDNSRKWKVYLDGEQLPYISMTIRRVPTQDINVYLSSGMTAKGVTTATTLGVSLECPSIIGEFNSTVKDYLLKGEANIAHVLTVELNAQKNNYLVAFGEIDATATGVLNVGTTITFVEIPPIYGIMAFPSNYVVYYATQKYTNADLYGTENAFGVVIHNDLTYDINVFSKAGLEIFPIPRITVNLENGYIVASQKKITNASNYGLEIMS